MNKVRSKILRAGAVLFMVALLLMNGLWLYQKSAGARELRVETLTPVRSTIEHKAIAIGTIAPRKEVKIKSQVNGVLEEVFVQSGQWVKKGDLLATVRLLADPVDVNEAQSQLNRARMEYERAKVEIARRQHLHEQRLISDSDFQSERLKYELSKEALDEAKRKLDLKLKGVSDQLRISSTRVLATVDGMVLERPVEVGDFITKTNDLNEGTTIATIADMNRLLFKGEVEETDAGRLKEGMPLTVTIGALPEHRFEAELEYIAPKAKKTDQGRITFEIWAALRLKPNVFVRAGYSATVEIVFARHENVLAIPESYLVFHNDLPYVRVETGMERIEERRISTGLSDGLNIEVVSGLGVNERFFLP
jgi:HlyD family secretion protein